MIEAKYQEFLTPFELKHCMKCWQKECSGFCEVLVKAEKAFAKSEEDKYFQNKNRISEYQYLLSKVEKSKIELEKRIGKRGFLHGEKT